jgi:hypothetical protein
MRPARPKTASDMVNVGRAAPPGSAASAGGPPLQRATTHLHGIDGLLQKVLTDLDQRRTELTAAQHRHRQLRGQGGLLWVSRPTHDLAAAQAMRTERHCR